MPRNKSQTCRTWMVLWKGCPRMQGLPVLMDSPDIEKFARARGTARIGGAFHGVV